MTAPARRRAGAPTASPPSANAPTIASETTRTNDPGVDMSPHETQVAAAREWFEQTRFDGIVRLHTPRDVAAQQGTIQPDYTVARTASEAFYSRLRELFAAGEQITT